MDIIKKELNIILSKLEENFSDPMPNEELKKFIITGSKLIRSKVVLLYLKAYNCNITDDIYNIISAGEIIHNASLLHDDVIDNAEYRRKETTIAKKYTDKISILAGDYLLSFAMEKILFNKNFHIIELYKKCTQEMSCAEIKQYFLKNSTPSLDDYIKICLGKTARLFSTMLEASAHISEIDESLARSFGEVFGIYFQIKNDLNPISAKADKNNYINTAEEILGIEKTHILLDNYKKEMGKILATMPRNIYKENLEGLIREL